MTPAPLPARCTEHARTDERVGQLEDRADKHDATTAHMTEAFSQLNGRLERIEGRLEGAMSASKMSGAIISALVTSGIAGLTGLMLFLLGKR